MQSVRCKIARIEFLAIECRFFVFLNMAKPAKFFHLTPPFKSCKKTNKVTVIKTYPAIIILCIPPMGFCSPVACHKPRKRANYMRLVVSANQPLF